MAEKLAPSERHRVTDETGRVLYEWDQTLRDVDVYVRLPAGVSAKELAVSIAPQHLRFGLAGNPPYLDLFLLGRAGLDCASQCLRGCWLSMSAERGQRMQLDLFGRVITDESTWMLEDGELHVTLQKAKQGEHWLGAMADHCVSEMSAQADRKRLLLERFQLEHPGMDFSGAEMSGEVPDPAAFLGGFQKQT